MIWAAALTDGGEAAVYLQPLARIDDPGERAWAAGWIAAILARERCDHHPRGEGTSLDRAVLARLGPDRRAHDHGSWQCSCNRPTEAGAPALLLGGPYGRLLDAEIEDLGEASVQAFEIEGLVGTGAARRFCPISSTGSGIASMVGRRC